MHINLVIGITYHIRQAEPDSVLFSNAPRSGEFSEAFASRGKVLEQNWLHITDRNRML